jgi:type VI secretion system protein ImpH
MEDPRLTRGIAPALSTEADTPWQPALERALTEEATSFDFYQAVRLLERLRPDRAQVGGFSDPAAEAVRFATSIRTSFPPSEIESLARDREGRGPTRLTTSFFGLTGPSGVMPLEYSVLVADRVRSKDRTLHEFLDLINHRLISLLYRAWERSRFVVSYERTRRDALTRHLLDLVGLGTSGLEDRLPVRDESLLRYAGLLAMPIRSAIALEGMLSDYFGIAATVEQFVGSWYSLEDDALCRLDDATTETRLGGGAVAGDEVWDCQGRIRVRLGPLTRAQYDRLLPNGEDYATLQALVRLFTQDELDAEVQLVLAAEDVPGLTLGGEGAQPLGWSSWIRSGPRSAVGDEMVIPL